MMNMMIVVMEKLNHGGYDYENVLGYGDGVEYGDIGVFMNGVCIDESSDDEYDHDQHNWSL